MGVWLTAELPRGVAVWPIWKECRREKQTNSMIWQAQMHPVFPCCLFCPLPTKELFVLLPSCWMWVINSLASGPGTNIPYPVYLNRMIDLGQHDCRPSLSCTAPQEHTLGELQAWIVLLLQDLSGLNLPMGAEIPHSQTFLFLLESLCSGLSGLALSWIVFSFGCTEPSEQHRGFTQPHWWLQESWKK